MTVEELVQDGIVVFRLVGDVDMNEAPGLKAKLAARSAGDRPRAVLNLENVRYMDSAGLGVLVASLKLFASKGGKLVLAAPRPEVRHILQITRLIQHFGVHATEVEAVGSLR